MQAELFPPSDEERLEILAARISRLNPLRDPDLFEELFVAYADLVCERRDRRDV